MNKFFKEIIIFVLNVLSFYLLPIFMKYLGPFGLVFLLLIITFVLSLVVGLISSEKFKYAYSALIAVVFIPTVWIYYNESALVHSLWYFCVSIIGLIVGIIIHFIINNIFGRRNKNK